MPWGLGTLAAFVAFFLGLTVGDSGLVDEASQATPTVSYPAAPYSHDSLPPTLDPALSGYEEGTYGVGLATGEIAPGRYKTDGSSNVCYWARLSNTDEPSNSILADNLFRGTDRMKVRRSDAGVEFLGACNWTRSGP